MDGPQHNTDLTLRKQTQRVEGTSPLPTCGGISFQGLFLSRVELATKSCQRCYLKVVWLIFPFTLLSDEHVCVTPGKLGYGGSSRDALEGSQAWTLKSDCVKGR